MPAYYKDFPELWRKKVPLDVLCVTVSPMDKHGYFSLGLTGGEALAQLERAKLVFAEVKTRLNDQYGSGREAVDERKKRHIRNCAQEFLSQTCLPYDQVEFLVAEITAELIMRAEI